MAPNPAGVAAHAVIEYLLADGRLELFDSLRQHHNQQAHDDLQKELSYVIAKAFWDHAWDNADTNNI